MKKNTFGESNSKNVTFKTMKGSILLFWYVGCKNCNKLDVYLDGKPQNSVLILLIMM